jgi:hypothetical protein
MQLKFPNFDDSSPLQPRGMLMSKPILFFVGILFVVSLLGLWGCARGPAYSNYYNPAWLSDGRIICMRDSVISESGGTFGGAGGSDVQTSIVIITLDSEGKVVSEQKVKDQPYEGYVEFNGSPKGNYIATDGGKGLRVWDSNFNLVSEFDLNLGSNNQVRSFDWSPDEEKLLVKTDFSLTLFSRSGQLIRTFTQLNTANGWKYSQYIAGLKGPRTDQYTAFTDELENDIVTTNFLTSMGGGVDQFFPGGQSVLGGGAGQYMKLSFPELEVIAEYDNLEKILEQDAWAYGPFINPTNPEQVMYSIGTTGTFSIYAKGQGIYLVNLDGSHRVVVKRG